jgi:hypothetical protein
MTDSSAEKLANVVIGAAVVGAAYYVLRTPRLRRMAWRLAVAAMTGSIPAWFGREIQRGWHESGRGPARRTQPLVPEGGHRRDMMAG